jgi:hypothetical protein
MKFTAEQIQQNWEKFISFIDTYISSPRKEKLKAFYEKYSERIALMPASHKKEYHNAFPGGYVDHVNRVIEGALKLHKVWEEIGVDTSTYTIEELVFSALNHDLGKMGDDTNEAYLPQTDNWRREKLGEDYMFNNKLEFMSVPDRGLHLLLTNGIEFSKVEMLTIKLHDGLYDESNKPYLMNWMPEQKPRTALIFIVHQADLMASRVEWEKEWFPRFNSEKPKSSENKTVKTKTLAKVNSKGLDSIMDKILNDK